ncbi:MAG TPA: right-handed parallel beta-helix repeat-containing protein, partial [candidate division Zixibacteria bacterium]|nr:right-handed parallel beta-helix repeat-containing protein [candidate division Zixibacteria bacterium]
NPGNGKFFVVPPLLSLLTPASGSRVFVKQPVLRWSALRDTSMTTTFSYQVALAKHSDFSDAVWSPVLGDTFWIPGAPLEVGTTYHWYATGFYGATADTVWSSGPFSFFVSPTRIVVPLDRPTIQDGIDAALNGDTVWVTPGVYTQNVQFKGKRIKVISEGGPAATFIAKQVDGLPLVLFAGNEDSTAVLDGFTLSGARQVSNGGAIKIVRASPRIENNYILQNSGEAGGVWIEGGSPKLRRNLLAGNNGRAAIRLLSRAGGEIVNCTIADNVGDGILVDSNLSLRITNCIVSYNTGFGLRFAAALGVPTTVTYNDFYANAAGDISGITPGAGNLFLDPQFLNRDSLDYRIRGTSPCRDAGDPSSPVPFGGGVRVDMGAFEFTGSFVGQKGDLNGDGMISLPDIVLEVDCVFGAIINCPSSITDINCSGAMSPVDIVWILNIVFRGYALPC